jgi:restriction endonuclease Mrr
MLKGRPPAAPVSIYGPLAQIFGLNLAQLNARRRTRGGERAWHNRVQTARKHLVARGLMDRSKPGFWSLTVAGIAWVEETEKLDITKMV